MLCFCLFCFLLCFLSQRKISKVRHSSCKPASPYSEFCFEFCFMGIEVSSLLTEGAFDNTLKSGSSDFQSNAKSEKGFRDGFC